MEFGMSMGVKRCIFALTGDLISSDRRTGELASIEYNRAHSALNAFEIISGMISRASYYMPVTHLVSVLGNEPRVQKDLELNHKSFYDNFDWVVDRMLAARHSDIKFTDFTNPVEKIITVDNANILLTHGLAKPRETPDKQFAYYKAKYPEIHHIICGHIHSELIAAGFSRSGGLPGANDYSTYTLGIPESRPSQTFHIVNNGRVYSFPVDLTSPGEDYFPFTPPPSTESIATVREVL
jgi:hypothetical protein